MIATKSPKDQAVTESNSANVMPLAAAFDCVIAAALLRDLSAFAELGRQLVVIQFTVRMSVGDRPRNVFVCRPEGRRCTKHVSVLTFVFVELFVLVAIAEVIDAFAMRLALHPVATIDITS